MQQISFDEVVELLATQDKRYHRDAYHFLREALDHTQRTIGKPKRGEIRHVSGQELLEGFREYALQQFGPMTLTVLEEWGVRACEDIGELVFNMVESGLLAKTDRDSRDDFKPGYDFEATFRTPFVPAHRRTRPSFTPEPEAPR